ncbi:MAG: serine hydroxymethyltransferase [Proteobacteria bacterium]|jgi:glycine hydroxymethyltransferase|nr:serine hydroxymethyltransferase [Pseudomonadota bacterium]
MIDLKKTIQNFDPQISNLIEQERFRQEEHIELIASENYASQAVLEAQGSILTNKYAEGYPNKRYYGGCTYVDQIEQLAIDRLKELFNAEYANVQPHSGSQANQAVYFAVLNPGDTVLGMSLSDGGHLTHGSPVNISGKLYNFISYGLNKEESIDYEAVAQLAVTHKPKLIIAGASAYSLEIDFKKFREIADSIGAYLMVDMAHYAGLIAADQYPSPIPYADFVTSTTHKTLRGPRGGIILAKGKYEKLINSSIFPGMQGGPLEHIIAAKAVAFKEALQPEFKIYQAQVKKNAVALANSLISRGLRIISGRTESHLMLVDLRSKNINGKLAEALLGSANITINKNSIPNDPEKPFVTSGIRLGTPAVTTRGFKETQCTQLGNMIADLIENPTNDTVIAQIKEQAIVLCKQFPVYA